jgi:hypothetical protein
MPFKQLGKLAANSKLIITLIIMNLPIIHVPTTQYKCVKIIDKDL